MAALRHWEVRERRNLAKSQRSRPDSNGRPAVPKTDALSTELRDPCVFRRSEQIVARIEPRITGWGGSHESPFEVVSKCPSV